MTRFTLTACRLALSIEAKVSNSQRFIQIAMMFSSLYSPEIRTYRRYIYVCSHIAFVMNRRRRFYVTHTHTHTIQTNWILICIGYNCSKRHIYIYTNLTLTSPKYLRPSHLMHLIQIYTIKARKIDMHGSVTKLKPKMLYIFHNIYIYIYRLCSIYFVCMCVQNGISLVELSRDYVYTVRFVFVWVNSLYSTTQTTKK